MTSEPAWRVEFPTSAEKAFAKLDRIVQVAVLQALERLCRDLNQNGRAESLDVKKLKGHSNQFRLRVCDYRVRFQLERNRLIILVLKVGHRRDVYRD